MRYLVTGHTGFKGAWLSLWLAELGHEVVGLALDPLPGGLYEAANIGELVERDLRVDIRDTHGVATVIRETRPDVVIHLAAQPLVRESYRDPVTTFTTNVDGTLNVLAGIQGVGSVGAALIVTTDKVYRNDGRAQGYCETDPLGGEDPYSASKAMADLLTQSWSTSIDGPPVAIARSGNVIGGGDVNPERLLPDLIAAYSAGSTPTLRYPSAVRPWQHVLDCLSGYLLLVDALLDGRSSGAWNFGPAVGELVTVERVAAMVAGAFGRAPGFDVAPNQPPESALLALDSTKARRELGWHSRLTLAEAVDWSVDWQRTQALRSDALDQIRAFQARG